MGEESGRRKIRGQIALEFMIVYTVVLVVFVIMFALIVNERSVTLGSQDSSLMQLIAENVAGGINQALQAGSGFAISVPLSAGIGFIPYKLYISSTGLVMAQTTVGKEVVSGIAASSARSLVVNGSVVNSSSGVYLYSLPTYVGFATLSNIKGTIYVDQHLPSLSALAGPILFNEPSRLKLPYFTGANSMITAFKSANLAISKNFTVDTWVYMEPGQGFTPVAGESSTTAQPFELVINNDLPIIEIDGSAAASSTYAISPGGWYNIAGTYNGTAASVYIDGALAGNSLTSNVPTGSANFTIGGAGHYPGNYLNGYEADVQLYNAPLTANQISQLYTAGPASNPKSDLGHLVGWWPLNGNSNDYSGYSTPTMQQNVIYTSALGVNIESLSLGGKPIGKLPLAISSTNNILGGSNSLAISTDADGYIGTLLSSNTFSGNARLNVLPYQGNISASANLEGWWPLDMGNHTSVSDFSGNGDTGTFYNGNYVYSPTTANFNAANFNGASSYISTPLPTNAVVNTTIFAFFNTNSIAGQTIVLLGNNGGTNGYGLYIGGSNTGCPSSTLAILESGVRWICASVPIYTNRWYNAALISTESGANVFYSLYLNGTLVYTATETLPSAPSGAMLIGNDNANRIFSGLISNVQIYNTTLSAAQISSLYSEGLTGTPIENSGLVGWWPLSGDANNYASIASGTSNVVAVTFNEISYNGTLQSNQTLFPSFNGQTSYVSIPNKPYLNSQNATVNLWVYPRYYGNGADNVIAPDSSAGSSILAAHGYPGMWWLEFGDNNNLGWYISDTGGTPDTIIPGAFPGLNTWYMITGVINNTAKTFSIYENGRLENVSSFAGSIVTDTNNILVGSGLNSGANVAGGYFAGRIVGFQIYNSSLSPSEIAQLYLQGLPVPASVNLSVG
ncbi:LamG domain-containing protein [Candidatus Marsarchaeota archaeon]|nr:LamG domain-containing protein [Candidatus Marsarchaeota archaeon]